jgi:predicted nucleic acid-binding protein
VQRCEYLANTNFVIDLAEDNPKAVEFARENEGLICVSKLLFYELEASIEDPEELSALRRMLRRVLQRYHIRLLPLSRERYRALFLEALKALNELGLRVEEVSYNTVHDTMHILIAEREGAVFVTGDLAACRRAIRLGVCCIYTRSEDWTPRCS